MGEKKWSTEGKGRGERKGGKSRSGRGHLSGKSLSIAQGEPSTRRGGTQGVERKKGKRIGPHKKGTYLL